MSAPRFSSHFIHRFLNSLLAFVLFSILSASRTPQSASISPVATEIRPLPSPALPALTPTPQPVSRTPSPYERVRQPLLLPTSDPSPLRLVFPTPAAAPDSAWRPPLYPLPWALTPYDHFLFYRPIAANEVNWPLADYRYGGVMADQPAHTGIDIPVKIGTPVFAAGPGKITWTGYGLYYGKENLNDPYGLAVAIRHDFGYQGETLYTVYGHMDRIDVAPGQRVQTGDQLGLSGETGRVTGPHLHFEVRIGKNNFYGTRNPELWLAPPQGWGILAARIMTTAGELLPGAEITVRNKETDQRWTVKSYGEGSVNSDPYYRENLVLGDLPAGIYVIWVPYAGVTYDFEIQISPGLVSYFTFRGKDGYKIEAPSSKVEWQPPAR